MTRQHYNTLLNKLEYLQSEGVLDRRNGAHGRKVTWIWIGDEEAQAVQWKEFWGLMNELNAERKTKGECPAFVVDLVALGCLY